MNTSQDEVLTTVGHELRMPLTAVLAYVHVLGSGPVDSARGINAIKAIRRNVMSMCRIVDDLLDAPASLGGRVSIAADPVDLVAVVRGALDDVHLAAESAGLHVTLTCCAAPVLVAGDALRLQQIVANLLSNAIKFTPRGALIEVQLDAGASGVELSVADTGQGIRADFLPHIFDQFFRSDDSGRNEGLGLGLAVVRALVERHGGTVEAESAGVGQGATFTVRLPAFAHPGTALGPRSNGHAHEASPTLQ